MRIRNTEYIYNIITVHMRKIKKNIWPRYKIQTASHTKNFKRNVSDSDISKYFHLSGFGNYGQRWGRNRSQTYIISTLQLSFINLFTRLWRNSQKICYCSIYNVSDTHMFICGSGSWKCPYRFRNTEGHLKKRHKVKFE